MTACPFCEGQPRVLDENELAHTTYALAPYHKYHLLVIPKRHVVGILDVTPEERAAIDALVVRAVQTLDTLKQDHISVLVRDGRADGFSKSVDHLHYHVVPKIRLGDVDHLGNDREVISGEEEVALMGELETLF
ncbi:MAG: hypothetical protein A2542_01450 [Parcubacteria group bacterium RIFOXYD2_FULL_52_8]|nr:MAG: hypothetical protein A2542_01450 [Parcubacteria group bacterium RIFOXYD2_FULL_52_8]